MTIAEAIVNADRLYPNSFTDEEKTVWLKKLDEKIHKELFVGLSNNCSEKISGQFQQAY